MMMKKVLILTIALVISLITASVAFAQTPPTIQSLINNASPGSTVNVPAGTYREAVTVNKSVNLVAAPGAEILGSDVWTGWSKNNAGDWVSSNSVPSWSETSQGAICTTNWARCKAQEQVFINGTQQTQINPNNAPAAGQFKVNSNNKIVLGTDPRGKTVEVTTRQTWFEVASDDVTISGFTARHAATAAGNGGIDNDGYDRVSITGNDLSLTHAGAVAVQDSVDNEVLNNHMHNNGQIGLSGGGNTNLLATGNEINANNNQQYDPLWEAGGSKMIGDTGDTFQNNDVYNNIGHGLWWDIMASQTDVSANTVFDNTHTGIHYEISTDAEIYNNTVYGNGFGNSNFPNASDFGWGAGILISTSRDVNVYDNALAWNADGIMGIEQLRGSQADPVESPWDGNRMINVQVYNNDVLHEDTEFSTEDSYAGGFLDDWGTSPNMYASGQNNQFHDNSYWIVNPDGQPHLRWACSQDAATISQWNATECATNESMMTSTEKDALVASRGLPAAP